MELEYGHIIVCYGPIVAGLRLLAYTLPVVLLWRVLARRGSPSETALSVVAVSLLPYLLCALAGTWQLFVFLRGLRMTENPFAPLVRAGLAGSLSLAHSGLTGSFALLFVSALALVLRRRVPLSSTVRHSVSIHGLLPITALLILAPVVLYSFPPVRLLSSSLDLHHLGVTDTFRLAFALAGLQLLGLVGALTLALRPGAVAARPSSNGSLTAFILSVGLLLFASWLFGGLPQHNEQPGPSQLRGALYALRDGT